jgi:replicative DNA helicase
MRIVPGIGWSLDQVCHAVQDACRRGCRVVGVDYLQAIPMPSSYNDKSAWYDVCARRIKAAGTTLGAHVIIGVQLNRPPDKDERKHRPNRFMGDYAAVCEQIAENYMLCWRREKGKRFEAGQQRLERATIIIDKAKEGEIGDIDLAWCQVKHMYRPWRDDETPELWEQKEGHRYAKR